MAKDHANADGTHVPELDGRDLVLDALSCGVIVYDAAGAVRSANAEARRLADPAALVLPVADVLATGRSPAPVERLVTRGGRDVTVRATLAPLRDAAGCPNGVVATVVEQCDADRLRALETAVESMIDGVFVVDRELRFVVANRIGCGLHGLRPEEVLGRRTSEFRGALRMRHRTGRRSPTRSCRSCGPSRARPSSTSTRSS